MDQLYIPSDIQDRGSEMKTQMIHLSSRMCDAIDYMLEVSEGNECPQIRENPRVLIEDMRRATLDMWVFTNFILNGEQTDASLMKAFIDQKAEILSQ